jgi:hypothetical protein
VRDVLFFCRLGTLGTLVVEENEMGEQNYSIDSDLKEAQTMAAALNPYIYEDELYGKVGANLPQLTLGALLLRLRRLQVLRGQMSASQKTVLEQIIAQHNSVHREWTSHYNKKLEQEVNARARDIQTYLKECREEPKLAAGAYMPEALRRTMIEEILNTMPDAASVKMKVKEVDSGLRRVVQKSDFIWSAVLRPIYPEASYWWLYSRPPR